MAMFTEMISELCNKVVSNVSLRLRAMSFCLNRFYIDLLIFLGKVHGSLARAGKVRGQTPKVSPKGLFKNDFILLLSKLPTIKWVCGGDWDWSMSCLITSFKVSTLH